MSIFEEEFPSTESYWRAINLFGRNVASYKFALAKALLSIDCTGSTLSLDKIAPLFSHNLCEHLKHVEKQTTSQSSSFLDTCRNYNEGKTSQEVLFDTTVKLGFNNVLDAFHVVNNGEILVKFFQVTGTGAKRKVILTDDLFRLKQSIQFGNLEYETEARWRLVETSWSLGIPSSMLQVSYDENGELLFFKSDKYRRIDVTSARDALNGYQKGKCFYCFDNISVTSLSDNLSDIDHFFPHMLQPYTIENLNGIWNLVLACKSCNRGINGKMARVPELKYLERLSKRNNFFIDSHHPLKETLINQTGLDADQRRRYLIDADKEAINALIHRWRPTYEYEPVF